LTALLAGASACMLCAPGTFSKVSGTGCDSSRSNRTEIESFGGRRAATTFSCTVHADCAYAGCQDLISGNCGDGGCCDPQLHCPVAYICYNYGCSPCPLPPLCNMGYYSVDGYSRKYTPCMPCSAGTYSTFRGKQHMRQQMQRKVLVTVIKNTLRTSLPEGGLICSYWKGSALKLSLQSTGLLVIGDFIHGCCRLHMCELNTHTHFKLHCCTPDL
jgi:hypothetical protein